MSSSRSCLIPVLAALLVAPLAANTPSPPVLISDSDTPSAIPVNASTSAGLALSITTRFNAYISSASNLVPGDTNGVADVFVFDRFNVVTERISVASDGSQANGASVGSVGMSSDARFIVFASDATNLVPGDTNGVRDIFLRDRQFGTTTRLSVVPVSGAQANGSSLNPTMTPDGNFVVFATNATNLLSGDTNGRTDVVRRDAQGLFLSANQVGATQGNGNADAPGISDDGRFVLFHSLSSNLVTGDSNGVRDVFRHDFDDRSVRRVSVDENGNQLDAESIAYTSLGLTSNGNRALFTTAAAAFASDGNNQPDAYVNDLSLANGLQRISTDAMMPLAGIPSIAPNGASACISGTLDVGGERVVRGFFFNFNTGLHTQLMAGLPADPNQFDCGKFGIDGAATILVAQFSQSTADHPTDRQTARRFALPTLPNLALPIARATDTTPHAAGNGSARSLMLGLADDQRTIAFASRATNLVAGDTNQVGDIFVRDTLTRATQRISLTIAGNQTDCRSIAPHLSRNGRFVVFQSCAAIDPLDTNGHDDIYRFDRRSGQMLWISNNLGVPGDGRSFDARVANDGSVSFTSCASNLIVGDSNSACDVFLRSAAGALDRLQGAAQPNGPSRQARLSADGRFVVFASEADNLVAGDSNGVEDVFRFDRASLGLVRLSVSTAGVAGNLASTAPEITGDGRLVSFVSFATNLATPALSAGNSGVFLRDTQANATTLLTRNAAGSTAYNGTISTRGGHSLSDDGRWLVFSGNGSNIFGPPANTGRTRIVRRDNQSGEAINLSAPAGGGDGDNNSGGVVMSADGGTALFDSFAGNLTANDFNRQIPDVFYARLQTDPVSGHQVETAAFSTIEDGNELLIMPAPALDLPGPAHFSSTLPVSFRPHGLALRGAEVLVMDFVQPVVRRVQLAPPNGVATVNLPGRSNGNGSLAVEPQLRYALSIGESNAATPVGEAVVIDFGKSPPQVSPIAGGMRVLSFVTAAITFAPDRRAFVCHTTGVSVLRPPYTSIDFTMSFPTIVQSPSMCALSRDGSRLFVTRVLSESVAAPVGVHTTAAPYSAGSVFVTMPAPAGVQGLGPMAVSPDGQSLMVGQQFLFPPTFAGTRARLFQLSAPFNASTGYQEIALPAAVSGANCLDDNSIGVQCAGFEHIALSHDGSLAILTGNSGAQVNGAADSVPAVFLRQPFAAERVISTVQLGLGNVLGRGAGAAGFRPDRMFLDGLED